MEIFNNLMHGFSVAFALDNLMWAVFGVFMGNLIGVLPGMGVLLVLLGLMIARMAAAPAPVEEDSEDEAPPDWRGWGCIIGGLLTFILVGKYGGLVPATFALVFISAMGDRQHTPRSAARAGGRPWPK